jgi:fatty acid-binding protein DegV
MIKDLINQKDNLTDQYINKYLENTLNTRAGAVIVPDITQLKKGGRVSNFKSIFIKLLGLKLIITLDKNGLLFKDKAGKLESAVDTNLVELDKILSYSTKKIKRALLLYNDCKNEKFNINEMIKLTENKFPNIKFEKTVLPAVITAHLGPNYFAVAFDVE